MASSLFSLVLLVCLIIMNLSYASCDLIDKVCALCKDEPPCDKALRSDPRSAKADLKGLGYISLDISKKYAEETYKYVKSMYEKEKARKGPNKSNYDFCIGSYVDVIASLAKSKEALDIFDISTYKDETSIAWDDVDDCEVAFSDWYEPPELHKANMKAQGLIDVTMTIGDLLDVKH